MGLSARLSGPHFTPRDAGAARPRQWPTLRRDLRAILGDGAAFSAMVGLGETYLPAFALAAGLSGVAAGLISVLPMLAGAVLQLASPAGVRWIGTHRRWVVCCAALQGASFLPLVAGALVGAIPAWIVFLAATLYWGTGMATGPAWNTWVGRLVPSRLRAHFFARRTRVSQACLLAGFVVGGIALRVASDPAAPLTVFAWLFAGAAACRTISTLFLAWQSEPATPLDTGRAVGLGELWTRTLRGGDSCLLLYLLSVQVAVQISGPYFTPFMLGQLRLNYTHYVILLGTAFAAKILALPSLGRVARRVGPRRLLWLGGVGITPVAALWLVSDSFYVLLGVQVLSGVAWAAYELAMFLIFFETIAEEERTSVLTTFNVGNAVAMVAGSLLGAALLAGVGESRTGYYLLFALSSLARLAALVVLAWVSDVRFRVVPIALRTLAINPGTGSIDRPILPSLPSEAAPAEPLPEPVPQPVASSVAPAPTAAT